MSEAMPVDQASQTTDLEVVVWPLFERVQKLASGDPTVVSEVLTKYVIPAAVALLVIFIGYLVGKFLSRVISVPVCKRVDETLGKFIGRVTFYGTLGSVTAIVLNTIGVGVSGVATVIAAAGFAIGLAFQGTLSNFAAGVLLLVFRPFKVGDVINVAGMMGKVNEIDLFTTTLDTPDNRRIVLPNSSISGGTIENISHHPHRRVEVIVGVAYRCDLDATRMALTNAVQSLSELVVPGEGRGHQVILATLADSSVQWKVRAWVNSKDFFAGTERLTYAIKTELDRANLAIPFPQLDVHLHSEAAIAQAVPRIFSPAADDSSPHVAPIQPSVSPHTAKIKPRLSSARHELDQEAA